MRISAYEEGGLMDHLMNTFKLLSDETRLRVVMLLQQEELCVCQITGITGIAQPKVSKALSKLRDLGLVDDRRVDKFVYYKLKKQEDLLSTITDHILLTVKMHPVLKEDQKRLSIKEDFLMSCNNTQIRL